MMDFFAKKFEGVCDFVAVLNFIIFGVAGYLLGYAINREVGAGILVMLISIPVCLLYNIFTFGLIAQIITMNNRIDDLYIVLKKEVAPACRNINEKLAAVEKPAETSTNESINIARAQEQLYQPDTYIPPSTTWKCKKCGAVNPINSTSCKDCGTYK